MFAAVIVLFLMAMNTLGALITIGDVGKPRGVVTPRLAVISTVLAILYVVGLGYVGSQL